MPPPARTRRLADLRPIGLFLDSGRVQPTNPGSSSTLARSPGFRSMACLNPGADRRPRDRRGPPTGDYLEWPMTHGRCLRHRIRAAHRERTADLLRDRPTADLALDPLGLPAAVAALGLYASARVSSSRPIRPDRVGSRHATANRQRAALDRTPPRRLRPRPDRHGGGRTSTASSSRSTKRLCRTGRSSPDDAGHDRRRRCRRSSIRVRPYASHIGASRVAARAARPWMRSRASTATCHDDGRGGLGARERLGHQRSDPGDASIAPGAVPGHHGPTPAPHGSWRNRRSTTS